MGFYSNNLVWLIESLDSLLDIFLESSLGDRCPKNLHHHGIVLCLTGLCADINYSRYSDMSFGNASVFGDGISSVFICVRYDENITRA